MEYNPTGDAGLDLALAFVGRLGFRDDRPEIKAAMTGDFGPLETTLKTLGDKAKGYQQYLTVAKDYVTRATAANKASLDATQAAVVKTVGGVAEWNAIHAWVKEHADATERKQINTAFAAGGLAATAMAEALSQKFKAAGLSVTKPASVRSPDAAATPAAGAPGGAITADQFKVGMKALVAKHGFRAERQPEARLLNEQRRAGIRAGI